MSIFDRFPEIFWKEKKRKTKARGYFNSTSDFTTRGTLQLRIRFVKQSNYPTLEQTNKHDFPDFWQKTIPYYFGHWRWVVPMEHMELLREPIDGEGVVGGVA